MTHYEYLQVIETASDEAIKGAYKYLSNKHHPDKTTASKVKAASKMKILNEAYRVLSDPLLRKEYDTTLANQRAKKNDSNYAPHQSSRQEANESDKALLYKAIIGEGNQLKYLIWFSKFDNGGNKASWNWAAFFSAIVFGNPVVWMMYRKMWLYGIVYFCLILLIAGMGFVGVGQIFGVSEGTSMTIMGLYLSVLLGAIVAPALYGNWFYYKHVNNKISSMSSIPKDEQLHHLNRIGGTSRVLKFLGIILMISMVLAFGMGVFNSYSKYTNIANKSPSEYKAPVQSSEKSEENPVAMDEWMGRNPWFGYNEYKTNITNEKFDLLISKGWDRRDPKTYDELDRLINYIK